MNTVRERLLEMGAEQGGRHMTIRIGGRRGKQERCASYVDGEWVATTKFKNILGARTPEESKEKAKKDRVEKNAEIPASTGAAAMVDSCEGDEGPVKKKAVSKKK